MPPSYEEAMHIRLPPAKSSQAAASTKANRNEELLSCTQDKEDCQFTPLYTVFNVTHSLEPNQEQQQITANEDTDHNRI